jgi:hypothetical protein
MNHTGFPRLDWITVTVAIVNFPLLGCSQSIEAPPPENKPMYTYTHQPSKPTPDRQLIDPNPVLP